MPVYARSLASLPARTKDNQGETCDDSSLLSGCLPRARVSEMHILDNFVERLLENTVLVL